MGGERGGEGGGRALPCRFISFYSVGGTLAESETTTPLPLLLPL